MNKDARVDDFINNAPPFAKPVLIHLRKLVHDACPQGAETIKWKVPVFEYKGLLCGFGVFKQHCAFNIFKAKLMKQAAAFEQKNTEGAGQFGRITSLRDLPADDVIIAYIKEAMKLNEEGVQFAKTKPDQNNVILYYPEGMKAALAENKKANDKFESLRYSHKKEYVEWIAEAKGEATRNKRIATMLAWLEEGKRRNWKYEKA